jgi:hypothetical protein
MMANMALPDRVPSEEEIRVVVNRLTEAFPVDEAENLLIVKEVMARRLAEPPSTHRSVEAEGAISSNLKERKDDRQA